MRKKTMTVAEAGRRGGLSTASRLTPEQRKEKARKAVQARWNKKRAQQPEGVQS